MNKICVNRYSNINSILDSVSVQLFEVTQSCDLSSLYLSFFKKLQITYKNVAVHLITPYKD